MKITLKDPMPSKEAAKRFGIHYLVLRRGILRGHIAAQRVANRWLVERGDAMRYANERRPFRQSRNR